MKSLSFELPDLNGRERGSRSTKRAAAGELTEEGGGEGNIGWRNPPGSCSLEEDAILGRFK